ncbi:MAG TPA: hypothetical protein VE136_18765, partial [Anaerolineales bacterium]|nr:hypothetical protein [Anaerolineales bacterium]
MAEALRFFRAYEFWIYTLLALGALIYIRKFILAWDELRAAAFGLERESAQSRLNQAASMLVLLLSMGLGVFLMVTFVAPSVPGAFPLNTPTLDLLATATTTLPAITPGQSETVGMTATPPTVEPAGGEGCVPGQVMLASPEDGAEVTGVITLTGTADLQNFGFYKYEVQRPDEPVWLTIQAGRNTVVDA